MNRIVRSIKRFLVDYLWANCRPVLVWSSFSLVGSAQLNAQPPTEIWTNRTGDNSWFTAGTWITPVAGTPTRIPTARTL
jgi:hypothetical protein